MKRKRKAKQKKERKPQGLTRKKVLALFDRILKRGDRISLPYIAENTGFGYETVKYTVKRYRNDEYLRNKARFKKDNDDGLWLEEYQSIYTRLKQEAYEKGYNISTLAKATGISMTRICRWWNGKASFYGATLCCLARVLDFEICLKRKETIYDDSGAIEYRRG